MCPLTTMCPHRGLRFDCKGSFKETVKIKTIFPRFARRSGGVTVTVTGENFGLTGSSTILRIDGRRARACRSPATEFYSGAAMYAEVCRRMQTYADVC